jgi:hypothetical protein
MSMTGTPSDGLDMPSLPLGFRAEANTALIFLSGADAGALDKRGALKPCAQIPEESIIIPADLNIIPKPRA